MVIAGIPANRTCTVTENAPSGGLANASYAWGTPTYSAQPVTIVDQAIADVTITNPVVQRFGTFSLTKEIDGPGGYTGGTDRVFPVSYSCTLTNGPTTTGTLNVTVSPGRLAGDADPGRLGVLVVGDAHERGRRFQRPELRVGRLLGHPDDVHDR